MRPTAELVLAGCVVRPADPADIESILEGIQVAGAEVRRALPWFDWSVDMRPQIRAYLEDVERMGRGGLSHHWVVEEAGRFRGLIALDHTPHLVLGHWNLGYWILPEAQGRGLASAAIDGVLDWIGRGGLTAVEMRVDPVNTAGIATAESACRRWGGHRFPEGDVPIEVADETVEHMCWLLPRLPPEVGA